MSKYTCTSFICDFCGKSETDFIAPNTWFVVGSYILLSGQFEDGNTPEKYPQFHACCNCGHKLHDWLSMLGVKHAFNCNQYSKESKPGSIDIE